MLNRKFVCVLVLAAMASADALAQIPVPVGTIFTYQGVLKDDGLPANGPHDFVFKLYNGATMFSAQVGSNIAVSAHVVDGLFTVPLDFGAAAYSSQARWLDISVRRTGQLLYTTLAPRQRLTPTPFAVHSATSSLGFPFVGTLDTGTETAFSITHNGTGTAALFEVTDGASGGDAIKARAAGAGNAIDAATTGFIDCAVFAVDHPGATNNAVNATNNGNGNAVRAINTSNGRAGFFQVNNADNTKNAVEILSNGDSASRALEVTHTGTGDNGYFEIANAGNGGEALEAHHNGTGNAVQAGHTGTGRAALFQVTNAANANDAVAISTNGNSSSRTLEAIHSGTGDNGYFEITNAASGGEALEARHNGSGDAVQAVHTGTGRAGYFQINNAANSDPALYCTTNGSGVALHANGTARVDVLEILGGSDLSEGFDITGENVQPGMVVAIDPQQAGRLMVTSRSYDTRVAGVVSGAGGVQPGLIMKQNGSVADGKHPVALTGRVFCMVDATQAAVEPGDLLVSSETPGHAMKSTEPARAPGAIIGKAMTALPRGEKGLVLVLVSLQ